MYNGEEEERKNKKSNTAIVTIQTIMNDYGYGSTTTRHKFS